MIRASLKEAEEGVDSPSSVEGYGIFEGCNNVPHGINST